MQKRDWRVEDTLFPVLEVEAIGGPDGTVDILDKTGYS